MSAPCGCTKKCNTQCFTIPTNATSASGLRAPLNPECSHLAVNKRTCQIFFWDNENARGVDCGNWCEVSDGIKKSDVCDIVANYCDATLDDLGGGCYNFTSNSGIETPFNTNGPELFVTVDGSSCGVCQSGCNGHSFDITMLSQDVGNLLSKSDNDCGLYLDCDAVRGCAGNLEVIDCSPCTEMILSGSGSALDPYKLCVDVVVDDDPCNLLECGPFGLTVKPTAVMVFGSDCIEVGERGTGTLNDPYRFDIDVITDPNGGIVCTRDGLGLQISNQDCNALCVDESGGLFAKEFTMKVESSGCITLTGEGLGTCDSPYVVTADIRISADPDNSIVCIADGLFSPGSNFGIDNASSECIELNLEGNGLSTSPYTLSASVLLDPDCCIECGPNGLCLNIDAGDDNQLSCGPDGLYVPSQMPNFELNSISECFTADLTGTGFPDDPYNFEMDILLATDGAIECRSDGLAVVISGDAGNILELGSDFGLFVPGTFIEVLDTDCLDLTITGDGCEATPYVISADIILDPAGSLSCGPDGLFGKYAEVTVLDTPCVDLTIVGDGSPAAPYVLSADLIFDPASGLSCGPGGITLNVGCGLELVAGRVEVVKGTRCQLFRMGADGCPAWEDTTIVENIPVGGTLFMFDVPSPSPTVVNTAPFATYSYTNTDDCPKSVCFTQEAWIISQVQGNVGDGPVEINWDMYVVLECQVDGAQVALTASGAGGNQVGLSGLDFKDRGTVNCCATIQPGSTITFNLSGSYFDAIGGIKPPKTIFTSNGIITATCLAA